MFTQELLGKKGIDHTCSHKNYSHVGHNKGGASGWRLSGKKGVGQPGPVELNGGVGGSHQPQLHGRHQRCSQK